MALGIKQGSINIILPKTDFSPGQKINGKIQLHLPNPTPARNLRIEFYGELKAGNELTRGFFVSDIVSEKESYTDQEEFDFALQIPPDLFTKPTFSITGKFLDLSNIKLYDWFISATLDIPKKLDITNRLRINLELPSDGI